MPSVVVATAYGGPEVLALVEAPSAEPGAGEVRLAVRAAGVNPADLKRYAGAFGQNPAELPMRLGYEASGVVTAVGVEAVGPAGPISVGDEVIAFRVDGAYATELVVPADAVLPRPRTLSWEQAGGLLLTGVTAVHALTAADVGAGDTVLLHGAAGGVGLMAVQLAVARGARVIGTAGETAHQTLRDLGAEPVVYGRGLVDRVQSLTPDGVDAAIDAIGTDEAVETSLALVPDRSRIASIAAFGRAAKDGIKLLGGGPGADAGEEVRGPARLDLVRLAEAGALTVVVAGVYPLADVAAAHAQVGGGHSHGKVVLVP
ncbi:MAG: quinone oxidoreductase family protein [Nocardioidaceae bacterium]